MLVTVVTPTLNAIAYLDECIRSVERQAGPNVTVEHIVVDGGSTDGTAELARAKGLTVLQGADSGLYDADNKGTAASSGELIGYLGADDLLLPGALDAVVRAYQHDRRPWVVGGLRWLDGESRSLGEIAAPPRWLSASMMAALGWCCVGQQATYVTRGLFDDLGGFDTTFKIAGDYDFYCKTLTAAPWSRVTQTIARFRRHGANLSMGHGAGGFDEYAVILDRHARGSKAARAVERQALRGYLNARNPTWAIRKKLGRAPLDASDDARGLVRLAVRGRLFFARASSPASKRAGWTFTDQALSSITNFALAVFVARAVEPREFGVFGLVFAAYLLLLNLSRGLGAEPLLLRFSAADPDAQRAAVPGASGLALLLGACSGLVVAIIALIGGGGSRVALLALAITLPGLLLQDTWRFVFFALARPASAALNDGVWALCQLVAFTALYLRGVETAAPFVLGWGVSACIAAVWGMVQARTVPSVAAGARWFMAHRDIGPMLSIEFFATGATGQLMLFSVALFAGLAAVGSLRAAQVALGPLGVIYTAILIVAVPELTRVYARDRHRMARLASLIGLASAVLALAIGVGVYVLPDSVGEQLLGDNWAPAHAVIIPSAIALALGGLMTGMFLQMRVAQAVKETLSLRIAMLVGAVALATLGAVLWDAKGAAWGLVIATAVFTWLSWRQARKVFARREAEAAAVLPT